MRLRASIGSSLIELLTALVLWGIVSTAVLAALLRTGRAARRTTVRAERREMLRTALAVAAFELRGSAGPPGTLLVSMQQVVYRARRWTGVTCTWPTPTASGLRLVVDGAILGERSPLSQRDSALVWIEGYPSEPDDGQWITVWVAGVATTTCPNANAAIALDVEAAPPLASPTVLPGATVVGFERAALRVYRGGDGDYWLGLATVGPSGWNAVQPVAGPLASSSRFTLGPEGKSVVVGLRSVDEADSATAVIAIRAADRVAP